jgi:hypothetical protein
MKNFSIYALTLLLQFSHAFIPSVQFSSSRSTTSGSLGLNSISEESTRLYPAEREMSDMKLFDGYKALSHERDA